MQPGIRDPSLESLIDTSARKRWKRIDGAREIMTAGALAIMLEAFLRGYTKDFSRRAFNGDRCEENPLKSSSGNETRVV